MPSYRVKGIKIVKVRKNKRTYEYHYHRTTGLRINEEPGTNAYLARVAKLDEMALHPSNKDIGALFDAFTTSPEWARLADRTKRDYTGVMDYLAPFRATDPHAIRPKQALQIRDTAHKQKGWRFGAMVVQFCRRLWNWGRPRELVDANPWADVELPRREQTGEANPPWSAQEVAIALMTAPIGLARGLALCAMGRDGADAIRVKWSDLEGDQIERGKTGASGAVAIPEILAPIFEGERSSEYVATNMHGNPYKTQNVLTKARREHMKKLAAQGLVRADRTTHGLRKFVAVTVSQGGQDLRTVQTALQHKTLSMALHYDRSADMTERNEAAMQTISDALKAAGFGKLLENPAKH